MGRKLASGGFGTVYRARLLEGGPAGGGKAAGGAGKAGKAVGAASRKGRDVIVKKATEFGEAEVSWEESTPHHHLLTADCGLLTADCRLQLRALTTLCGSQPCQRCRRRQLCWLGFTPAACLPRLPACLPAGVDERAHDAARAAGSRRVHHRIQRRQGASGGQHLAGVGVRGGLHAGGPHAGALCMLCCA